MQESNVNIIPNRQTLIRSIPEPIKEQLYKHFEGAAHPDELIYLAWLWANHWIDDPEVKTEWILDPRTNEEIAIGVLDLDKRETSLRVLFDFWKMEELRPLLNGI